MLDTIRTGRYDKQNGPGHSSDHCFVYRSGDRVYLRRPVCGCHYGIAREVEGAALRSVSTFDLTPDDLGLPPKFDRYRLCQRQALSWFDDDCTLAITAACLPTGAGKTALGVSLAGMLGVKTVYAVATKALADQVHQDFESVGMADIRGRANYTCPNYRNCDDGHQSRCSLHLTTRCPYTAALERAKYSELIVTNYSYWLNARRHNGKALERKGRPVELLICDEAHALESQLSGFAAVKIYASELGPHMFPQSGIMGPFIGGSYGDDTRAKDWHVWAVRQIDLLMGRNDEDEADLVDRCKRILKMNRNWVWQFESHSGHVTFSPIRVGGFAQGLFGSVPHILLMSASLNEFVLERILGLSADSYDYRSWASVFPGQNSPVYHVPTRKLSWKSTDEDYKTVIEAMDAIIDRRSDRKGIIHTVSYARTQRALQHSRHRDKFIWNKNAADLSAALERFRENQGGGLLVTPSVEEGFDFPGDQAEYQVLIKFPFPNETQRVIKERCTQIPGYRLHYAAQKVVQIKGRPVRSETDRSELFILDNACKQLTGPEGRSYCPPGFRIFTVTAVPPPPPRVVNNND